MNYYCNNACWNKNQQGNTDVVKNADLDVLGGNFREINASEKKQLNIATGLVVMKVNNGVLKDAGKENVLMTRMLGPREILTVRIGVATSVSGTAEDGMTIQLDTTRIWSDEEYVIGAESAKGDSPENAMSVSQAKSCVGEKDVWVCGYIVGGDLSRTSVSFSPPFSSGSNLAVASRSSVSSRESCIAVSVPAGDIRDVLSLAEHPENIGRRVYLKGDIVESYFGLVGVKNVTDCVLK